MQCSLPKGMSNSDLKCLGSTAETGLWSLLFSDGPRDIGLGLNSASLDMLYLLWSAVAGLSGLAGKAMIYEGEKRKQKSLGNISYCSQQ